MKKFKGVSQFYKSEQERKLKERKFIDRVSKRGNKAVQNKGLLIFKPKR